MENNPSLQPHTQRVRNMKAQSLYRQAPINARESWTDMIGQCVTISGYNTRDMGVNDVCVVRGELLDYWETRDYAAFKIRVAENRVRYVFR